MKNWFSENYVTSDYPLAAIFSSLFNLDGFYVLFMNTINFFLVQILVV